jgi:hypothetical protein
MSRKSRLFELMMKRETLRLRQKADALSGLVGDQTRLSDLDEKLADLIVENSKNHGTQTVSSLRSQAFYGREMAEQREYAQNRLEFLGREIETAQTQLAQSKQKEKMLEERAAQERRLLAQDALDLADRLRPAQKIERKL